MEVEIAGVIYEAVNDIEKNSCQGCVAEDNENLCHSIGDNSTCWQGDWEGVIWIKKEITAPTGDETVVSTERCTGTFTVLPTPLKTSAVAMYA